MTESANVSVLVVDDEPVARAGLRRMLVEIEWIACIGEATSGPAAVEAIDKLKPDVVLLDVQMPGLFGTEVLRQTRHQPYTVFTTAYAEYAVTAFELGALDYLLKPFGTERLLSALDRVRAAMGEPLASSVDRFAELLGRGPMSRLFVRAGRGIVPVPVTAIAWFEAVGDYVIAHCDGTRHMIHLSLSRIEERLDPQHFLRIHRTHIVNLDQVAAFKRQPDGRLQAMLKDGTSLSVSKARAQELRKLAR